MRVKTTGRRTVAPSLNVNVLRCLLLAYLACQCSPSPGAISKEASDYLNRALDVMRQDSVNRKQIDWRRLRSEARAYAKDAQTTQDTYPAIMYACRQLQDHSSSFQMPADTPASIRLRSYEVHNTSLPPAHGRQLTDGRPSPFLGSHAISLAMLTHNGRRYAYLVLRFYSNSQNGDPYPRMGHEWAEGLFRLVAEASRQGVQGWILDLRGGSAPGYPEPPLAGLQALLGNGKVLEYRGVNKNQAISVKDGAILDQGRFSAPYVVERIDERVDFSQQSAPVAILVDRGTQIMEETLAIAFEGRDKTYFIGERTTGRTDALSNTSLSDGAVLSVESWRVLDRRGFAYSEGVDPNLRVEDPPRDTPIVEDPAVAAAEKWLDSQK
jgi:carboxyl-terminal processing protease